VTIDQLDIVSWNPPSVGLRVTCSGGTYIRSLAHDLGQALQVGAYLAELVRERSGSLTLASAVPLDVLEAAGAENWEKYLQPMQSGLGHLAGVSVDRAQETDIRQGRLVTLALDSTDVYAGQTIEFTRNRLADAPPALVYAVNPDGVLFAILQPAAKGMWQPHKVLDV
jgi:tRNA pseudouridine55 synthase